MQIRFDWKHALILVVGTVTGASFGYLEQQSASTILDAFQSWDAFKHMLGGIGAVDLVALVALAKQSFLVSSASGGGQGRSPYRTNERIPDPPPPPPAVTRGARRVLGSFAFLMFLACAKAIPVVVPSADLLACVAQHALNGESITQIAQSCETDIPSVIAALLSSKDPNVRQSPAFDDAVSRMREGRCQ